MEKQHGEHAPDYIGEQVKHLALEADAAGVATRVAIAERYDALRESEDRPVS